MRLTIQNITAFRPVLQVVFLTLCHSVAMAAESWRSDDQIKAAYIFNLLKFTSWPETNPQYKTSNITVCLSGAPNAVAKTLANELRGRTLQNKSLAVIYIPELMDNHDEKNINLLQQCQLLYLGEMTASNEQTLINYTYSHSIVSVSDSLGFTKRQGMVELQTDDSQHKISLVINIGFVEKANIVFSSKLLQLARLIRD